MTEANDDWQVAEDLAKKHEESSSTWLKLANDGDKAVVVFLGGPYTREMAFVDGKYVVFDDAQKAAGQKSSLRVAINVALYDTKEVKVLEQGVLFFKDLMRIRKKYGIDAWAFEVERHGAAKDPKTTYSILPEHQLSAAVSAEFQALTRIDLPELYAATADDTLDSYDRKDVAPGDAARVATARAVIDEATAQGFAAQLKELPRAAVERFCGVLHIARIKELPVAQLAQARTLLETLVAEHAPAQVVAAEQDPFA